MPAENGGEITEFGFIDGHKLVIQRSGKKYPVTLVGPDRNKPIPIWALGKDFWFEWERKKDFIAKLAEKVGHPSSDIVPFLEKIGSKIQMEGKRILEPARPPKKDESGRGEDNKTVVLSGEFAERLEREAFSLTKPLWDRSTKFFVFVKKVTFQGSDKVIEVGDAVELPAEMADELWESGLACEHPWQCCKCKAAFLECPEGDKCPNCFAAPSEFESSPMVRLRPEEFSAIGNVLLKNYRFATPIETISESKLGLIHLYNQGHYTKDGAKGYIKKKVKEIVPDSNPGLERAVLNHIAVKTVIPEDRFGIKGERAVVENGILHLNEKKLTSHNPDEYALTYLPIKYNPESGRPTKFLAYLNSAFPNKIDIGRIQEFSGTILIPKKIHKKGLMLVGPTDVGKSTFVNIFRGVCGEKNVSAESPSSLANTRWGKSKLRGKLLNATDEVLAGELRNIAIVKEILDGDPIDAEDKFEKKFQFRPTCEHIFGCNLTPTANRRDDAFWNRWLVIEMLVEIPLEKQDRDFAKKLMDEKEAILNWMIEGYERFKRNGYRFSNPQRWKESRDKWLNWGDSIQRFIQRCVIRSVDRELKIEAGRLYEIYLIFAEELDLDIQDQKELTTEIKKLPYAQYSNSLRFDGRKQRGFKGIDIKLDTLTTDKLKSFFTSDINFNACKKYSDFVTRQLENQRSQRSQNDSEEQQKLVEVGELGETPKETSPKPTVSAPKHEKIEGGGGDRLFSVEFKEDYPGGLVPKPNDPIPKGTVVVLPVPEALELKRKFGFVELKEVGGVGLRPEQAPIEERRKENTHKIEKGVIGGVLPEIKPEKIEEKPVIEPTPQDDEYIKSRLFREFGMLPFKPSQVRRLFEDDATRERAWAVIEDMRGSGDMEILQLMGGNKAFQFAWSYKPAQKPPNLDQTERVRRIHEIIALVEKQYEGGAPVREVRREAEADGISQSDLDEAIDRGIREGILYEPRAGSIAMAVK